MQQTMFTFTDERISVENLGDGRHVVKVTPGGTRILAYLLDGKVRRYEAEDATGNRQPLVSISQDLPTSHVIPSIPGDPFCHICTHDPDVGAVICYEVLECPPHEREILPQ